MRVIGFYFDILSRIALAVLLGFVIGYSLAWAVSNGYFQVWRQLPSPPSKATALLTAARESIYIKATDDRTYRCSDLWDECWFREPVPVDLPTSFTVTRPCIFTRPEFFLLANAPRSIADCLQVTTPYPDGYGQSAYILDRDGKLWIWSHITDAYTNLIIAYLFPGVSLIVGLGLGILWAKRNIRKAALEQP